MMGIFKSLGVPENEQMWEHTKMLSSATKSAEEVEGNNLAGIS